MHVYRYAKGLEYVPFDIVGLWRRVWRHSLAEVAHQPGYHEEVGIEMYCHFEKLQSTSWWTNDTLPGTCETKAESDE